MEFLEEFIWLDFIDIKLISVKTVLLIKMTKAKNKVTKRNKGKKFKFNYSNQNKVETKGSVFA